MAPKVLENRLDKTMIKYNEAIFNMLTALQRHGMTCDTSAELFLQAQSIRKTYEVGETGTKFLLLRVLKGML